MRATETVRRLDLSHANQVVAVLAEAFAGYPLMRFVLGDDDPVRLGRFVRLLTMARVLREEPILGIRDEATVVGAALASDPGGPPAPAMFWELWTDVWGQLGRGPEARFRRYAEAVRPFVVEGHLHLEMAGVRRDLRRLGLGRILVDAVQDLSRAIPGSRGVSLTTEEPSNLPFYRELGFEPLGHAEIAPGIETWGFVRQD